MSRWNARKGGASRPHRSEHASRPRDAGFADPSDQPRAWRLEIILHEDGFLALRTVQAFAAVARLSIAIGDPRCVAGGEIGGRQRRGQKSE